MTTPDSRSQLVLIWLAVDHLLDLEGQDRQMVAEMSQDMLNDVITAGELGPLAGYVARYCDVIDSRADAERIAAAIEESAR